MADKLKKIYYFSSTHWDREWYRPFQGFRFKLVNVTNEILDTLLNDKDFTFIFDGQTIVLEDFSLIEPQRKETMISLIKEGRIIVGPWYTMPDEVLLSGESLIRNLMIGHQTAEKFGAKAMKYGYICDIFGHIAQMPQILNGFEIKGALLGRGTNMHNCPAFFVWESPDGSNCLTFKVPETTGYGSFWADVYMKAVEEHGKKTLTEYASDYVEYEKKRTELPFVVLMDGMDHEHIHPAATKIAKELSAKYSCPVVFENMENLVSDLEEFRTQMPLKKGELLETAKMLSGHNMLITNTLSSRYDLKKANDHCQMLLEKWADPFIAISALGENKIQKTYSETAYKYLIQNHAHDSICGCSIDHVHRDMHYRFRQSEAICEEVIYAALNTGLKKQFGEKKGDRYALSIYNPLLFARKEVVTAEIHFQQNYPHRFSEMAGWEPKNAFKILNQKGEEIPYKLNSVYRGKFEYRLDHNYKDAYDVHNVTFLAELPPMGSIEYLVVPFDKPIRYLEQLSTSETSAENEYLRFSINDNGSVNLFDKISGKSYENLCSFVDNGEVGDGWFHAAPIQDRVVSSTGSSCIIEKIKDGPVSCTFAVTTYMRIPEQALYAEGRKLRSENYKELKITAEYTVSKGNRYVDLELFVDNQAKDHRLRMKFPTGIPEHKYYANQPFAFVERTTGFDRTTGEWKEAGLPEKAFESIVMKKYADQSGIALISKGGVHECAALDDDAGTFLITLLRAFSKTHLTNGQPDGELQGMLTYGFRIALVSEKDSYADLIRLKDAFQAGFRVFSAPVPDDYHVQTTENFVLTGSDLILSVMKASETNTDKEVVVRISNYSGTISEGSLICPLPIQGACETNLLEEKKADASFHSNILNLSFQPWQIKTFRIQF